VTQVAVAAGRVDKIKRLLELGVDARATDLNGNTYYHLAAREGKMEVLKAFVDDVDMTSVNNDGDTALHLAANSGHVETVKLLLQKSKLDARNK
jgi:ankyrin repeat protein